MERDLLLQVTQNTKAERVAQADTHLDYSVESLRFLPGAMEARTGTDALDDVAAYVGEVVIRATGSAAWTRSEEEDAGRPVVSWRKPRSSVGAPRVVSATFAPSHLVDEHRLHEPDWVWSTAVKIVDYVNKPRKKTRDALGLQQVGETRWARRRRSD